MSKGLEEKLEVQLENVPQQKPENEEVKTIKFVLLTFRILLHFLNLTLN